MVRRRVVARELGDQVLAARDVAPRRLQRGGLGGEEERLFGAAVVEGEVEVERGHDLFFGVEETAGVGVHEVAQSTDEGLQVLDEEVAKGLTVVGDAAGAGFEAALERVGRGVRRGLAARTGVGGRVHGGAAVLDGKATIEVGTRAVVVTAADAGEGESQGEKEKVAHVRGFSRVRAASGLS